VIWRRESPEAGSNTSGEAMTTTELLEAVESSLQERRGAGRGRKFRL
jgi:hypothetical protein